MSHFTVLVVGPNPELQLRPFQENNMGDCPKEFLEFVDHTAEVTEVWNNLKGDEYTKYKNKPIEEFAEDYFGYRRDENGERFGYYENPNAKWDWYLIGGRWTGFFKLKPIPLITDTNGFATEEINVLKKYLEVHGLEKFMKLAEKYGEKKQDIVNLALSGAPDLAIYPPANLGQPGVMTEPCTEPGKADQALKKDIDFESMRGAEAERAGKAWDKAHALFTSEDVKYFKPWIIFRDKYYPGEIDRAREEYHKQPAVKKLHASQEFGFYVDSEFLISSTWEQYVKVARMKAISTFAVLMGGKWYARGDMGWWGSVGNENDTWDEEYEKLLNTVPDDTMLTIVDCHI